MIVFIAGATGYVGSRLAITLAQQGHEVRCMARDTTWLASHTRNLQNIHTQNGDIRDPNALRIGMSGAHVAYYLVHAMGTKQNFEKEESDCAKNFAAIAVACDIKQIVYLGGLSDAQDPHLSPHLRSRLAVGRILRDQHPLVLEFRASVILGTGSLSFELIRALVEKLPVMVAPRWVSQPTQPISIEDVMAYLVAALNSPFTESTQVEIGGPDILTYKELMLGYARMRGLRRHILVLPLLTPRLSSLWLGLVTPVYARVGKKLIESLRNPSVVHDALPSKNFDIQPMGYQKAIERILGQKEEEGAWWYQAQSASAPPLPPMGSMPWREYSLRNSIIIPVDPKTAQLSLERIGGEFGYIYGDWLWGIRGWIDLLLGGVGRARTRYRPKAPLREGDILDWWRVEKTWEDGYRFRAEMRLPGKGWWVIRCLSHGKDSSEISITTIFHPSGWVGVAYWYLLWPIHWILFSGLLKKLKRGF